MGNANDGKLPLNWLVVLGQEVQFWQTLLGGAGRQYKPKWVMLICTDAPSSIWKTLTYQNRSWTIQMAGDSVIVPASVFEGQAHGDWHLHGADIHSFTGTFVQNEKPYF